MASSSPDSSAESLLCWEEDISSSPFNDAKRPGRLDPIFKRNPQSNFDLAMTVMQEPDLQVAVSALVDREASHAPSSDYVQKYETKLLDAGSRQKAISWLFKARAFFKFSPLTAVLSVNYFDRFLTRYQLPMGKSWMFQLLSVACLSLAAKMVEVDVPLLLDLQVAPDCLFEPRTILRMELLVLTTLEWRTDSVTPFSYIEYFIVKCRVLRHNTHEFLDRITDLILQSVKDLKFASHPSSAVAAASFLCSTKEMFPSEFEEYKMIIFSLLPSSIQDASIECLDLMIEQFYLSSRMSLLKAETCIDSTPLSPAGVLDASFSTDSDSTFRSVKSEQSTQILCPALKKRRVENICMNVIDS